MADSPAHDNPASDNLHPRKGWLYTLVAHDRHLFLLSRARRSKWLYLTCFCKRIRNDGSCKRTDALLDRVPASDRARTRVEHVKQEVSA